MELMHHFCDATAICYENWEYYMYVHVSVGFGQYGRRRKYNATSYQSKNSDNHGCNMFQFFTVLQHRSYNTQPIRGSVILQKHMHVSQHM